MAKLIKISELRQFNMAEYLQDEQSIANYLAILQDENNPVALEQALNTMTRELNSKG
jgi:DNA-binding phage protein